MKFIHVTSAVAVIAATVFGASSAATTFRFPVADSLKIQFDYVVYADHDPQPGDMSFDCLAWGAGMEDFPYCYDDHDGTDFMLVDGFATMDLDSADIVAAADGKVIALEDGNYDRCHADLFTQEVTCDGNPMRGNYVKLEHSDGMQTWYWHMKKGSVAVTVGQQVSCGDVLGKIGSSGYSSNPHLHFEVRVPTGNPGETTWIDPFAGPNSQAESYWVLQHDPTTLLPGAYCTGDDIPDFPEPDQDTGTVSEEVAIDAVGTDAFVADVQSDVIEPVADVVDMDPVPVDGTLSDAETGVGIDAGTDGMIPVETDVRGDASIVDAAVGLDNGSPADAATNGDNGQPGSSGSGCSSGPADSPYGLMALLAIAMLAFAIRRRGRPA